MLNNSGLDWRTSEHPSEVDFINIAESHHYMSPIQVEIDGRYPHFRSLKQHGEKLVHERHYASADIQTQLTQLDSTWVQLNEAWEDRRQLLAQCYDLQVRDT